jgi:hypothetical protein
MHRYLQHVLPNGKKHIRNFGFLTNNQIKQSLPKIRAQLGVKQDDDAEDELQPDPNDERDGSGATELEHRCPECGQGQMTPKQHWARPTVAELLARPWRELNGCFNVQQGLFDEQQLE